MKNAWQTRHLKLNPLTTICLMAAVLGILSPLAFATSGRLLYSFTGQDDGGYPNAPLAVDSKGDIFGTATFGGAHQSGTVFEFVRSASGKFTFSTIYSFLGTSDGSGPEGIVVDASGNVYGVTGIGGGGCNCGLIFELSPSSNGQWTEETLYRFTGGDDGSYPLAAMVLDSAGNLYGTASAGGSASAGTVFELSPSGNGQWNFQVIYTFEAGTDGDVPYGGVIFDQAGNLYGTTVNGGTDNFGTIYELTPNGKGTWAETILHNFGPNDLADGFNPYAGVTFDAAGNLWGTTQSGGEYEDGTLYRAVKSNGVWTESVEHTFQASVDGLVPYAGVTFDNLGRLYTMTSSGGAGNDGDLVRFVTGETILRAFSGPDGDYPHASLVLSKTDGNLYGTTESGGAHGYGEVFQLIP